MPLKMNIFNKKQSVVFKKKWQIFYKINSFKLKPFFIYENLYIYNYIKSDDFIKKTIFPRENEVSIFSLKINTVGWIIKLRNGLTFLMRGQSLLILQLIMNPKLLVLQEMFHKMGGVKKNIKGLLNGTVSMIYKNILVPWRVWS